MSAHCEDIHGRGADASAVALRATNGNQTMREEHVKNAADPEMTGATRALRGALEGGVQFAAVQGPKMEPRNANFAGRRATARRLELWI